MLNAQATAVTTDSTPAVITPRERRIAAFDIPIHQTVAPSPDGRFFAALQTRPDPVLWIVPTDGGEPFAFRKQWATYYPRWAPSGNRVGFIAAIGPTRIWTVEVDQESGRAIDPPRMLIRTNANAFAFSPDGNRIALVEARSTAAGASEIHIVDWESRRYRVLLRDDGAIYRLDWAADGESVYYGIIPNDSIGPVHHRIVKASAKSGAKSKVLDVVEFIGLSLDGSHLAYRPIGDELAGADIVELASTDGAISLRLAMPTEPAPRWSADPGSFFQARIVGDTTEIWQISF
jgi:hypothetical protein